MNERYKWRLYFLLCYQVVEPPQCSLCALHIKETNFRKTASLCPLEDVTQGRKYKISHDCSLQNSGKFSSIQNSASPIKQDLYWQHQQRGLSSGINFPFVYTENASFQTQRESVLCLFGSGSYCTLLLASQLPFLI